MYYIGIDIGGTGVKAGVVDSNGKIVKQSSIKTGATRHCDEVILDIANQVKELSKGYDIQSIGIGCPGAIETETGIVKYSNNLYWTNVPLGEKLSKLTGKKVTVSNDANVAALGEAKFGAGVNASDVVLFTLGTGVGGGFVVGDKLFEGFKSMGGELGHTVIKKDGAQCSCGRKGCLEAYASATALIRETINAMMSDKNSLMWKECENDLNKVDGRTSFEAAKKGDASAKAVVKEYCESLAEGILNVVNVFRSQVIILGGGVCAQGEYLTKPVQEYVDKYRYGGRDSLPVKVVTAALGNDAGILGAASLAIDFDN